MSYPQFGYTYPTAASTSLASSQILMSSSVHASTSCCETGRPIMTDPHTGQTVCSCQYTSSLLNYPRVAGLPDSVYSSPYAAAAAAQTYVPGLGADPSAFYPLNTAYDLKDNTDAWRSLSQPTACYPYDPAMAGYPYGGSYGAMDLNGGARRKNATRETTSTLKAWLYEHRKNPYPTKGEKIMLAIITKMTLTQVSTWFANARRRLKKENKMTWSPRNRCGDGRDPLDSDVDDDDDARNDNKDADGKDKEVEIDMDDDDLLDIECDISKDDDKADADDDNPLDKKDDASSCSAASPPLRVPPLCSTSVPRVPPTYQNNLVSPLMASSTSVITGTTSNTYNITSASVSSVSSVSSTTKPRIWSLAHTATSSSPPLARRSPPNLPIHVTPKPGQNLTSPMNSLRQWVDSSYAANHHPTGTALSQPYPLSATHPLSTGMALIQPSSSVSTTHSSKGADSPPGTPPMGTRSAFAALPSTLGFTTDMLKLHNGLMDRPTTGEQRDLSDMRSQRPHTIAEQTKTAFRPVTKSRLNEVVKV